MSTGSLKASRTYVSLETMRVNWWVVGAAVVLLFPEEVFAMLGGGQRLSQKGIDFLIHNEGIRTKPYNDAAGHCTIGIGHLLHKGPCNGSERSMTEEEVRDLFEADQYKFVNGILRLVRVPLAQHELDALFSFVFNIGLGGFERSTVLKRLNAGDRDGVPSAMAMWNKETRDGKLVVSESAVNRRIREGRVFTHGQYMRRDGKLL